MFSLPKIAIHSPKSKLCFLAGAALVLTSVLSGFPARTVLADSPPGEEVDILIKGGRIIDGSGGPWMQGDVAIKGDKIVYVGRAPVKAKRTIDATGQTVAPGFFDMHSHSEYGLAMDGRGLSKVTQGVTTEVMGEHLSAGPVLGPAVDDPMMVAPPVHRTWTTLAGFWSFLEKRGLGPNIASYVGAGQVRASVVGYDNRPPTADELKKEEQLVAQAMQEGAMGLSAGRVYVPNSFMTTAEMIDLAKVAAGYGGIYSVHMLGGPDEVGLKETIAIARGANIPAEIFHINSSSSKDTVGPMIQMINQARAEGVDITANGYPYVMGWTYLKQLLPTWAQAGNDTEIVARLRQPEMRARAIADLQAGTARNPGRLAKTVVSSANLAFDGHSLQDIATSRNTSVEAAMIDILIQQNAEGFQIAQPDPEREPVVRQALNNPWVDIGSDGIALAAGVHTNFGKPHPRSFGTNARVLGQYAREDHVFTLEEAIRKMTSQPANRLGISDRGLLRAGMKADVVVFNANTIRDVATVDKPEQYAQGFDWVFVNGVAVVASGQPTNARPGHVLHGPGYKPGTP
jgi:N-acyl-D-amino-acid deacylase